MSTDPLFMKIGSEYYYYHNDHIGTPQKMTSVSGAVVWSAKYGSFGEASIDVGTVTNNLRFAGQYFDVETGLHYNWFRYYNPTLERYLRADPIGLKGGINLYTYVDGNPVNLLDPFGLYYGTDSGTASFNAAMASGSYSDAAAIAEAMGWGAGMAMANAAATSSVNPESRTIPMPDKPKCGCTCICRADADDTMPGNISPGSKRFAFGSSTAKNCSKASKEAKRYLSKVGL